ncbi:hypothetical protein TorRG33x02_227070 [Trema orientale]|uniref:Transmembrane protein n=1 Tax=Trema orientale TaxID=63057 RepID=A0A2P5E7L5_TREOI|nr:hypothetical protein TorRG33x02_227070 [Trema orientale]
MLKRVPNFAAITFNKSRKLSQKSINLVLIDVTHSATSTNNTNEQQPSQKGPLNRSVPLQATIATLITAIFVCSIVGLGVIEGPFYALRRGTGSPSGLLKGLLLGLLERRAWAEEVDALVGPEAEEKRRRRSEGGEARRRWRPKSEEGAHFKQGLWRRIGLGVENVPCVREMRPCFVVCVSFGFLGWTGGSGTCVWGCTDVCISLPLEEN